MKLSSKVIESEFASMSYGYEKKTDTPCSGTAQSFPQIRVIKCSRLPLRSTQQCMVSYRKYRRSSQRLFCVVLEAAHL